MERWLVKSFHFFLFSVAVAACQRISLNGVLPPGELPGDNNPIPSTVGTATSSASQTQALSSSSAVTNQDVIVTHMPNVSPAVVQNKTSMLLVPGG